jgi:hypothetical protein
VFVHAGGGGGGGGDGVVSHPFPLFHPMNPFFPLYFHPIPLSTLSQLNRLSPLLRFELPCVGEGEETLFTHPIPAFPPHESTPFPPHSRFPPSQLNHLSPALLWFDLVRVPDSLETSNRILNHAGDASQEILFRRTRSVADLVQLARKLI